MIPAAARILIGDMPGNHARVLSEPPAQRAVDPPHLLPHDRRGGAEIVPLSRIFAQTIGKHLAHFHVLLRHPVGQRRRRRGEDRVNPVLIQPVDDLSQPVQIVDALLKLQFRPGKDPQTRTVHMSLLHQSDILRKNIRPVQPLIGVVIPAVQKGTGQFLYLPFHNVFSSFSRFTLPL